MTTIILKVIFPKKNAKPKLATKMALIIIANCNLGYYSILFLINPGLKDDLKVNVLLCIVRLF